MGGTVTSSVTQLDDQEGQDGPSGGALYRQVAADLREAITTGAYGEAGRLPAEGALAERYGVSRGTVRQALAVLRADGLVTSRRGTRRVVLGNARVQSFSELLSFTHWARALGEEPGAGSSRWSGGRPTPPNASSCAWSRAPRCT